MFQIGLCFGSTSRKGLSLLNDPFLYDFLSLIDSRRLTCFVFQYGFESSESIMHLLSSYNFLYPYPSSYLTNPLYLTKLLQTIDLYIGPEGGTTRVAIQNVRIPFIYRSSFDSTDLLPFQSFRMPGTNKLINSILSLSDPHLLHYLT